MVAASASRNPSIASIHQVEPHLARQRLADEALHPADLESESGQRVQMSARGSGANKRGDPRVAPVLAHERARNGCRPRQRVVAHGAASSSAATRRHSPIMML